MFCGGAMTYDTMISPSHGQIGIISEPLCNTTGLTNNNYFIVMWLPLTHWEGIVEYIRLK